MSNARVRVITALSIAAALSFVSPAGAEQKGLQANSGDQDGYVNDKAYNNTDPVLLCGQDGFVAVMEFPLNGVKEVKAAKLHIPVSKVKKPGKVQLYHLASFNNGYAETQDYYADADKVGEAAVEKAEKPGEIVFDVTQAVRKDAQGPGGFTSYRLQGEDAQIVLPSFEGKGKAKAEITVE